MLSMSTVAAKLFDPDPHVRGLALRCLEDASDQASVTAEDLWRMIDELDFERAMRMLHYFPQTENSLRRTLQMIEQSDDEDTKHAMEAVLADLSFGMLIRFSDEIQAASGLSEDLRTSIARRLELAEVPPAELWERLKQTADALERDDSNQLMEEAQHLIESLSRSPEAGVWAIGELNNFNRPHRLHVYLIELLGRMKHRGAVELIYKTMVTDPDADYVVDAAVQALVEIGSPQVVELCKPYFHQYPDLRFHFADIVGRTKVPQSDSTLVEFLKTAADRQHRTAIAAAMCSLPTDEPAALEMIRTMINEQKWDPTMLALDEDALGLFKMVGRDIPEMPRWEAAVADEPARMQARRKSNGQFLKQMQATSKRMKESPIQAYDDLPPWELDEEPQPSAPMMEAPAPIRRSGAKIGRNDPCPCGSGKKFKKCCGK
jgi:hypothetical protein